mgnify:CR=1 FL=1
MVLLKISAATAISLAAQLQRAGVLVLPRAPMRLVTHLDVDAAAIDRALAGFQSLLRPGRAARLEGDVNRVGKKKPITQKRIASTPRTPAVQTSATMPVMIDAEARTMAICGERRGRLEVVVRGCRSLALLLGCLGAGRELPRGLRRSRARTGSGRRSCARPRSAFLNFSDEFETAVCSAAVRSTVWRMVFAWKKAHRFEASMLMRERRGLRVLAERFREARVPAPEPRSAARCLCCCRGRRAHRVLVTCHIPLGMMRILIRPQSGCAASRGGGAAAELRVRHARHRDRGAGDLQPGEGLAEREPRRSRPPPAASGTEGRAARHTAHAVHPGPEQPADERADHQRPEQRRPDRRPEAREPSARPGTGR